MYAERWLYMRKKRFSLVDRVFSESHLQRSVVCCSSQQDHNIPAARVIARTSQSSRQQLQQRRKLLAWFIGGIVELLNYSTTRGGISLSVYEACARLQLSKLSLIFFSSLFIFLYIISQSSLVRTSHTREFDCWALRRDNTLLTLTIMTKWAILWRV